MSEAERQYTAGAFVVFEDKTILRHHSNYGLVLQPGGHVEANELPHEAALREVFEETGLTVTLVSQSSTRKFNEAVIDLPQPRWMLLEDINRPDQPFHQHIDIIYLAQSPTDDLPSEARSRGFKWYSATEIKALDMPDDVRQLALEALDALK